MTKQTNNLLEIRDLNVHYKGLLADVHAVRGVDVDVTAGEALAIVGESGSGKSTVALALLGLLAKRKTKVTGQIHLDGVNILENNAKQWQDLRGRDVAMIFQDPMTSLNPYLSVGHQVAEPILRHEAVSWEDAKTRAIDLLEEMEVRDSESSFKRYPHQFSGGMRQRAMIASAFSTNPKILLADEPTTALDVITQAKVLRLMKRHLADRNMALILITHDLGIVAGLCDRVVVMKDGEVVEQGTATEIYGSPKQDYTKALLAAVPRVDSDSGVIFDHTPRTAEQEENPEPIIRVENVSVHFHKPKGFLGGTEIETKAVDDVSIELRRGEVLGLVGQSGSGKSTLIRAVAGLQTTTAGVIRVNGVEVDARDRGALLMLRRELQMIFQDPLASLNGRFTAERIIADPLINFGLMSKSKAIARAWELMELVNLEPDWGNRFPHEFSGGQCQRIGIARALAVDPKILLCDEPVSALDVSIQAEVLKLLMELRSRLGLSILFISHDLAVVRHLADRVAVMHKGEIVELKNANEIYTGAEHDYTKSLLAAVPIPDPTVNWLR